MGRIQHTILWDFEIINPLLAEICRKNGVELLLTGNLIQSGNSNQPCIMEQHIYTSIQLPSGGSIASWFLEMGRSTGIINETAAKQIADLASEIDKYTYYYQIEHINIDPNTYGSFIHIEKRCWNEAWQYGFTESEFEAYRERRRKNPVPEEMKYVICNEISNEPLCDLLWEGHGFHHRVFATDKGKLLSNCFDSTDSLFLGSCLDVLHRTDVLRQIIRDDTRVTCPVTTPCVIPHIQASDSFDGTIKGVKFSLTSITGKEKTTLSEYIKRNGGGVFTEFNANTTVFIARNIGDAEFIKENISESGYLVRLAKNALLNGISKRILGEKVSILLEEDFWKACQSEEFKQEEPGQIKINAQGDLELTMTQAEAVWTVKTMKSGLFSISKYTGKDETLLIPAYIDGTPVATIDKGRKNATVKRIVIPGTVQRINSGAFPGYARLESIEFKSSSTCVGTAGFSGCPLMFDENNCFAANGVLQDCNQSGDIVIRGKISVIPDHFVKKSSIQKIITLSIENPVEEIGQGAFSECKDLKSVSISDSVKRIWNGAFMSCGLLENVIIGNSIEEIHYVAFGDCSNLKSITLGDSLKFIEQYAFSGCRSLTAMIYNGSVSQWVSIKKEPKWDHDIGKAIIYCTDGTI